MNDAAIRAEIQKLTADAEVIQFEPAEPDALGYQPFPVELIPEPIRGFIKASAAAIGCDPAFIALPLLAALASAIGNSRRVALKRRWTEPAILWVLIIAASGGHKSPGFDCAMLPIRKRQEKAKRRFNEAMSRYEQELEQYKQQLRERKNADAGEARPQEPSAPVWERCWTDDTTVEALAPLLLQNPRGLLLPSDELSAWFASFDRYAKGGGKGGSDAARWLHIHGGRALVIDRKTGEPRTIYVPRATVSVAGGIQPGVLRRTLSREHQESGMAARFLFAMPPKRQKRWTEAEIDEAVEASVMAVFDRLFDLQPGKDEDGEPMPRLVKLSTKAKHDHWIPYVNELGEEQVAMDDDLSATWSKLEGYAARLALVHYLIRVASNDHTVNDPEILDEVSMAAGIALSRWFGQEAKRVFAMLGEDEKGQAERELIELIDRLGGTVTGRKLQQHSRKYKTAIEAEHALQFLVQKEKGDWKSKPTSAHGGRPTTEFVLRRVDTTPEKPKENGGSVNVNGDEQPDDWGEA